VEGCAFVEVCRNTQYWPSSLDAIPSIVALTPRTRAWMTWPCLTGAGTIPGLFIVALGSGANSAKRKERSALLAISRTNVRAPAWPPIGAGHPAAALPEKFALSMMAEVVAIKQRNSSRRGGRIPTLTRPWRRPRDQTKPFPVAH